MSTFGENLKALRKSRNMTQGRFAKEIGSNQVNVSAWELGNRMPSLETIRGIADCFHVPLSSLISVQDTGFEDDFIQEVTDVLEKNPKLLLLFERIKFMSQSDIDVVLSVVDAITRERAMAEQKL